MSTTTQRPMPETDAVLRRIAGGLPAYAIELRDKALSLERERDEALAANFRQATCLHECAASISHDTSFSIDVLPNAVKHVVRERDEAREQLESILSVIPADAPCLHAETGETVADYILDLQKEVGRVHALYFNDKQQLEAMREAIKEAHGAFDEIASGAACLPGYSIAEASTLAQTILAKIQPFIKP